MHMQQCRSTCGCQLAQRVSVHNNDMLFPTWAWLNTKLWGIRLYILYSWSFAKNSFLVTAAQRESTLWNSMDKCMSHAFIYVMNTKLYPHYCRFFWGRETVDLLSAVISSWSKSSNMTEVFIMLIMDSNHRGMPCACCRVQSLPAQGLSFAGASNKHSKQMLSSNWFKMWCIYSQGENVCLVWIINLCMGGRAFFKG